MLRHKRGKYLLYFFEPWDADKLDQVTLRVCPSEYCITGSSIHLYRRDGSSRLPEFGDTITDGCFGIHRPCECSEALAIPHDSCRGDVFEVRPFLDELLN